MKIVAFLLLLLLAIAAALAVSSAIYVVDETEQVLVTEYGRPIRTVTEPGRYLKIPFVQKAHYYDKGVLDFRGREVTIITRDGVSLRVAIQAKWRISDVRPFMMRLRDRARAEMRLTDVFREETRAVLNDREYREVVDSWNLESGAPEPALSGVVLERASGRVAELGIEILDVRFERLEDAPGKDGTNG